jgi:DNA polymerase-3 subunit delta
VYYLHGVDTFRKDAAIAELCVAAVDPAMRDFNLDVVHGGELDPARLSQALDALPMLAERRVVVVREVSSLRKKARGVLDTYLGAPALDTILVLVSQGDDEADKELTRRATSVAFPALRESEVVGWLTQRALKIGVALTTEAATLLAGVVDADLGHAAGELEKLASFAHGGTADAAAVEAVVGVRRDASTGSLLDAVAARDARRAIPLVGPVLGQPKVTAVSLVSALTAQTLALAWGRAMVDAGTRPARLKSEFFALLKAGGGSVGRPWGEAVQCWVEQVARWSPADLASALDHLLAADFALKETRASSDDELVSTLVLALCALAPRRVAA